MVPGTVLALVHAVPPGFTGARVGERFTLRPGATLRLGPGREARIRIGSPSGTDLILHGRVQGAELECAPNGPRASLSGADLSLGLTRLQSGDSLCVHPGLVVRLLDAPPAPSVRAPELERLLLTGDDEASWSVYADLLDEGGDPLGGWIRSAATLSETDRRRALWGLGEPFRGGLLSVEWHPHGLLRDVSFHRQALSSAPGLWWLVEQLERLPVARLLRRLSIPLFEGPFQGLDGAEPDQLAADVLARLASFEGAFALQTISLGFVTTVERWPLARAAWERLRAVAPSLGSWEGVVGAGGRAMVVVERSPNDVRCVSDETVLHPVRSDVGTATTCLVRLVGDAPPVCCSIFRSSDGRWTVFDASADPFRAAQGRLALRVNGSVVQRATLHPGDTIEPVRGLELRFELVSG